MLITKIRKFVIKYHIGTFMVMMFMFVSCTKDKTIADLSKRTANPALKTMSTNISFTDDDVFRGVLFLDGPVASLLGDFTDFNIESFTDDQTIINKAREFQNLVIANIKQNSPSYLNEFRTKIGSGDIYIVQSTLNEAAQKVYEVAQLLSQTDDATIQNFANTFLSNFMNDYSVNQNTSKAELLKAAKTKKKVDDCGTLWWDHDTAGYSAVAVVAVVAIAVVIALVIVAYAPSSNFNSYLGEKYQSTITLNLVNI